MMRRSRSRPDDAVPSLLVVFLIATLAMVVAVALLLRGGRDWDDLVAVALLLALAGLVLAATGREAGQQEQTSDAADPGEHRADG